MLMTASSTGRVWTYALELCGALGRRGVEVTLAVQGAPLTALQWAQVRGVPGLTLEQSTWKVEGREDAWEDVALEGAWFPHAFTARMHNLQRAAAGEEALISSVEDAWRTMALVEACHASSSSAATPIPVLS